MERNRERSAADSMKTACKARLSSLVGTMRFLKPLLLLLIPFSADLLSSEVFWSISDHLVMGAILLSAATAWRWTCNRWPERKWLFTFLIATLFILFLGRVGCGHIGHRMGGIISAVSNGGSVWEEASGVKSFGSKGMSERPSVRRLCSVR